MDGGEPYLHNNLIFVEKSDPIMQVTGKGQPIVQTPI